MNGKYSKELSGVMKRLFEDFAMIFPEPEPGLPLEDPEGYITARVEFRGAREGSLDICVPGKFCRIMASNVLGLDADDPQALENGADSLKELANLAAGHFVGENFGAKEVFDLLPPEISRAGAEAVKAAAAEADLRLSADGHPVIVTVRLK